MNKIKPTQKNQKKQEKEKEKHHHYLTLTTLLLPPSSHIYFAVVIIMQQTQHTSLNSSSTLPSLPALYTYTLPSPHKCFSDVLNWKEFNSLPSNCITCYYFY